MKLLISSPTRAFLSQYTDDELSDLKKALTYTNTSIKHQIKRHYNNVFLKSRNIDAWQFQLDELKKELKKTLVFEEDGQHYIRPGTIPYLSGFEIEVVNEIQYSLPKKMAWKNPPKFILHPYQEESWLALIKERHGNVSLTTGSGKSLIVIKLCRELGLNTCIVVPSRSIFEELLEKFEFYFGRGNVGTYGAGKKKLGKKFTIAIGDSLANINPDSEEYKFFSNLDVLVVDESHEFAAESLEAVCHGILLEIPYRYFFSATQVRNDGTGPLLNSIIGKTVCTLTTQEAVCKGYICPHEYRIISVQSSSPDFKSTDALAIKREIFLKNRNIAAFTAKLANAMSAKGQGTLVLVEELSQISMLLPMLTVPYVVAHSEKQKDKLEQLKLDKVDNKESVESFNKGEVKVLIGTSCIATGTNIYPCHSVVNWRGGSSPIKTKQGAVGRAVRFGHSNPWAPNCMIKDKAIIYDFDIEDNFVLSRHLQARMECYRESGENLIRYIRLKT